MREAYDLQNEWLTESQQQSMDTVAQLAIQRVESEYGGGYPHFNGGVNGGLAYHNLHHTAFVVQGSERMADELNLGRMACMVARSAAAAHDIVQLKPRGVMERESADWLEGQLCQRGLPPAVLRAGSLAILGTEPVMDGVRVIGQKVDSLSFPDKAAELVARSVASADLAELYDPYGPYHGHRLWQEIKGVAPHEQFPMEGIVGFQKNQLALVNDYRFPHPKAERLFGKLRGVVIKHHEQILQGLESGAISTGEELLAADMAFAVQHC